MSTTETAETPGQAAMRQALALLREEQQARTDLTEDWTVPWAEVVASMTAKDLTYRFAVLAARPDIPLDWAMRFVASRDGRVRKAAYANPALLSEALLAAAKGVGRKSPKMDADLLPVLGRNPSLPLEAFRHLITRRLRVADSRGQLRWALAENPSLPRQFHEPLIAKTINPAGVDIFIDHLARHHANTEDLVLDYAARSGRYFKRLCMTGWVSESGRSIGQVFVDDVRPAARMMVARRSSDTSLLARLARDSDPAIAAVVAERMLAALTEGSA